MRVPQKQPLLKYIAAQVQVRLLADLNQSRPIKHPGTKGDVTESAWLSLFRDYLPTRFRVAKGIVINYEGRTSGQIDCVIFDSLYTPQIIPNESGLYVPVEAVHAVFEVKQTVNKRHLEDSAKKIKSVRDLARTSAPYTGNGEPQVPKPDLRIIGGLLAFSCAHKEGLASKTFAKNISEVARVAPLDFVFSAENGYADLVQSKHPATNKKLVRNDGKPFIVQDPTGISYGLTRLLEELSWQGTVPATEWPKYLSNLAKPKTIEMP